MKEEKKDKNEELKNKSEDLTSSAESCDDETAATGVLQKDSGSWKDFFKITKDDVKTVIFTVIVALLLVKFVAQPVVVDGHSMDDTLHDGERLLIEKVSRYYGGLDRFDIVVFDPENDTGAFYIKRIIGLPGEKVKIDIEGNIYIDGEKLEEHYGRETILDPGRAWEEVSLGEDEYFVMGDNRNDSLDSRFYEVGNVDRSQIIGKVMIQIFPFRKVQ